MSTSSGLLNQIMEALKKQFGDRLDQYAFPPPVFSAMQGEFLNFEPENNSLSARFPILENWLNPYGIMQGGMIAAAIDNTIGPLSALIAPANVTRRMEVKYSRSITTAIGSIIVVAQLLERKDRWLTFSAEVYDPQGQRLAKAKSKHWILAG